MKLDYQGIKLNFETNGEIDPEKDFLILLHGFLGSAEDWLELFPQFPEKYNLVAMDLIGHGKSDSPSNPVYYNVETIVNQIKFLKDHLTDKKVILLGYSMGGRAALNYAVTFPDDLKGLIIESATAGMRNDDERQKRYESDMEIVKFIENHTMDEFIDFWQDQEMFNTQRRFSNDKIKKMKKKKAGNSKIGIINSLKGFSTGIMKPLHTQLKSFQIRSVLITGELDTKFTGINIRLAKYFFKAKHKIVKYSGHNTHLEEPKRFIEIVTNYLDQLDTPPQPQIKKGKQKK